MISVVVTQKGQKPQSLAVRDWREATRTARGAYSFFGGYAEVQIQQLTGADFRVCPNGKLERISPRYTTLA